MKRGGRRVGSGERIGMKIGGGYVLYGRGVFLTKSANRHPCRAVLCVFLFCSRLIKLSRQFVCRLAWP